MKHIASTFLFVLVMLSTLKAQTGISIGPPRVYYSIGSGQSQTEQVTVTNPSKDYTLELGVSLEDWEYSPYGENVIQPAGTLPTSCADWVTVPNAFFTLAPGETKEIDIQMSVPQGFEADPATPVYTAMLFVTQLNPRDDIDESGANIRVAVRTGIKLYHRPPGSTTISANITDFRYITPESDPYYLSLHFENTGTIWANGVIYMELLNQRTGEQIKLPHVLYYSMPGDQRIENFKLPNDLIADSYIATAILEYGDKQALKIAELEFTYDKPNHQ